MGLLDGTGLENLIPEDKRGQTGTQREWQTIRVMRVKVKGKWHSRAEGFDNNASDTDVKDLCQRSKKKFSCGGKVNDNSFDIHGDHADKLIDWLKNEGYTQTKRAGG